MADNYFSSPETKSSAKEGYFLRMRQFYGRWNLSLHFLLLITIVINATYVRYHFQCEWRGFDFYPVRISKQSDLAREVGGVLIPFILLILSGITIAINSYNFRKTHKRRYRKINRRYWILMGLLLFVAISNNVFARIIMIQKDAAFKSALGPLLGEDKK